MKIHMLAVLLRCAIGLIWAIAGVSKLMELFGGTMSGDEMRWVSGFPAPLIFSVALAECLIATLFFGHWVRSALFLGTGLLLAFLAALWIWPPGSEEVCGCLGKISLLDGIDPVAKIIFFAGLHTLVAAAFLTPMRIRRPLDGGEPQVTA